MSLIGQVGCVTKVICGRNPGRVRIKRRYLPAVSDSDVSVGSWVHVVAKKKNALVVEPINVWRGSHFI
jgi:membrane-bound ClpP family serine protease